MPPLGPGNHLPAITLRDEKGKPAALPQGETLYGFFKTTCPTSELAWPYLDRVRRIGEGGLSVVAVSQDDPVETAGFSSRLDLAIPTLYDAEPWPASEALGLTVVPTFLLVGGDHVILDSAEGFARSKMEEFAARAAGLAGRTGVSLFEPGENVPAIKPG